MLKKKRLVPWVIGAATAVLLTGLFAIFNETGLAQQNKQKQTATVLRRQGAPMTNQNAAQPTAKELDDSATPIVDLEGPKTNSVNSNRAAKSARFDKYGLVKTDLDPRVAEVSIDSHWQGDISDLPTDKSDLIVEGQVTDSAAFLSNDNGAVYSEFTIRVTDVFRTSNDLAVNGGDAILTERLGGRVRYPNGQVVRYGIAGQGSPIKGKKYLLFLSTTDHGNFKILTGYEVHGNKVFALDGSRINRRGLGSSSFDKHNDEDYQTFRKTLGEAIKNPRSKAKDRSVGP